MNRRNFIKLLAMAGSIGGLSSIVSDSFAQQAYNDEPIYAGWRDSPQIRAEFIKNTSKPFLNQINQEIRGTGKGKVACLWKHLEEVTKEPFKAHNQTTSDCWIGSSIVLGNVIKPIEEIQVNDLVLTGQGKLTKVVSKRIINDSQKNLIKINATGLLPMICTEDHRLLVYRMIKVGKHKVNLSFYNEIKKRCKTSAVIDCYEKREPTWVTANNLCDTDYLLVPQKIQKPPMPESPRNILGTEIGRYILGIFLGDGYAGKGRVSVTFHRNEDTSKFEHGLNIYGFKFRLSYYKNRNAKDIKIWSPEFSLWLRKYFYDENKVKVFPAWIIGDKDFLEGLHKADGHKSCTSTSQYFFIDSTSLSVIYGTFLSLIELGFEPTINKMTPSKNTFFNAKPLYRVTWIKNKQKNYIWRDETFVCYPIKNITICDKKEPVYDIGVEDEHHSFLVNGIVTHNCVGHAYGAGIDILTAVQIVAKKAMQKWIAESVVEIIYGGSRVEISKDKYNKTFFGGGTTGICAAEFIKLYGTLVRQKYLNGKYDFTEYAGDLSNKYGETGVPDELEPLCKLHPIGWAALVTNWEEARDCIYNGYPVILCSNQGFYTRGGRDKDGFLIPSRKPWAHSMILAGMDDEFKRPGGLVINSWGCLDEQTEILTNEGWKFFEDLTGKELIATLNQKQELEYQKPQQYHRYSYHGYLWSFRSRDIDFSVTPNHKLYIAKQGKDFNLIRADECIQTVKFKKNAYWNKSDIETYKVGNYEISMDLWLEFLGYFISKGCVFNKPCQYKNGKKNGYSRIISISQTKEPNTEIIWKCLQKLPFKFVRKSNEFRHTQNSSLFKNLLNFGKSHEKFLPDYVWYCSQRQLKILYSALMLGDGCVNQGGSGGIFRCYSTSSKRLADDMQRLLLHCGLCGDITCYDNIGRINKNGLNGREIITRHKEYKVGIKKISVEQQPRGGYNPILTPYNGFVYCVTTENGVIYVRRNGKAHWTGNSDWISGLNRWEAPPGSFWVDASVINRMCKSGDTIAISSYVGYPRQDYLLW